MADRPTDRRFYGGAVSSLNLSSVLAAFSCLFIVHGRGEETNVYDIPVGIHDLKKKEFFFAPEE